MNCNAPHGNDRTESRARFSQQASDWWKLSAIGVPVLLGTGIVALLGATTKWVGHTDLEIRFVVTDVDSGRPVPNASVQVRTESSGRCDNLPAREFTLTTDENGQAWQAVKGCTCYGSEGAFENTFVSYLPQWSFRVTANNYSSAEVASLELTENARQVTRGPPFATLCVPIRLRKSGD